MSSELEKVDHFSLPVNSKVACVKLQDEQVSIMHDVQFPYLHTGK
jgi:hypothetical protein